MGMLRWLLFLIFVGFVPLQAAKAAGEGNVCEVLFSPDDHLADRLITLIEAEEKSIVIASYAFSHSLIAKALCAAKERGVQIELIVDPFSLNFSSALNKMARAGIPILVWSPPPSSTKDERSSLMHDKFCIFGDKIVWTGSFNLTHKADHSNQENALIIHDKALVKKYKKQFQLLKDRGCRLYQLRDKDR